MYYVATVILKMSPTRFWLCTPRKLHELSEVHIDLNSTDKNRPKRVVRGASTHKRKGKVLFKDSALGYIDDVL